MASTVLPNGIIIPEKYSRDWYNDLYHNWQELDNLLGGGTPKDGTLTIQKNGSTVGTFSANQATDETIDITVPTVNDATLTIQKNGTTVDTFTANSSTDKTVNITVPAATSELTNDSGFITEDTTKIPLAGSNAISGSLIPSTDGTVNLGGPSYQWNNAYIKSLTINGVACGDILTHNASEFVDVSNNQTIGGVKTFSNGDKTFNDSAPLRIQGCNHGNEFSNNARTVLELRSNRDTADKSCIYLTKFRQNRAQGSMGGNDNVILTMDVLENEVRTNDLLRFTAHNWVNDAPTEVYLEPTTKVSNIQSFLGSSTRPWGNTTTNAINGLNPGALSLPGDAYIDIDTTNYAWGSNFTFTPDYDGYCFINIGSSSYSRIISLKTGRGEYYFSNQTDVFCFTFPVYKGKLVTILTNSSGTESVIPTIRVFSCQGNV